MKATLARTAETLTTGLLIAGVAAYIVSLIGAAVAGDWAGVGLLLVMWVFATAAFVIVTLIGNRLLRARAREQQERQTDPWAPGIEEIPELSTDELIATWGRAVAFFNAGTCVPLANAILAAVEDELTVRRIPLCTCGAPRAGSTHTFTCQES
ncbi:hypothetical protein [Nonomuraea angiospora]|uniref:hypothetical protein n=1 Tax=Nonomuraea angiospora TaxID=46172 RepID=UPI0029A38D8E|nr:hypothetical protein [Nonomuraea angiospora]MDX3109572.1 hypothetical protein [Nonomuraea angiospora]